MLTNTRFTRIGGGVVTKLNTPSSAKSSQKNIFKPLIASSLALALGVSVASAAITITSGGSSVSLPLGEFNVGQENGYDIFTRNGSRLNNLMIWIGKDSGNDFVTTGRDPVELQLGANSTITSTNGIRLAGGTLFLSSHNNSQDRVLDFNATPTNGENWAIQGHLSLEGSTNGVINAQLGGKGISGNLVLKTGNNNITFSNDASVGEYIMASGGTNVITFDGPNPSISKSVNINGGNPMMTIKNTGGALTIGEGVVIGSGAQGTINFENSVTIQGEINKPATGSGTNGRTSVINFKGETNTIKGVKITGSTQNGQNINQITFEDTTINNTIRGEVRSAGANYSNGSQNHTNKITFNGSGLNQIIGSINANVDAYSGVGKNEITFNTGGKIQGSITASGAKNVVAFAGDKDAEIIGNITANAASGAVATNTISFSSTATNTITGDISGSPFNSTTASNTITFTGGTNIINGAVKTSAAGVSNTIDSNTNSLGLTINGSLKTEGGSNTLTLSTGDNAILNSSGDAIKSEGGTNNITFGGTNATISGNLVANGSGYNSKNHGTNIITFNSTGANTITGNITSKPYGSHKGTNTIVFTAGTNNSITGTIFSDVGNISGVAKTEITSNGSSAGLTINGEVKTARGTNILTLSTGNNTIQNMGGNAVTAEGGTNTITFDGTNATVIGNITANGSGYGDKAVNTLTFNSAGINTITGNIVAEPYNGTSGSNTITFSNGTTNTIEGNINANWNGGNASSNTINSNGSSAGLAINGTITASAGTNTITFATGTNSINSLVSSGGSNTVAANDVAESLTIIDISGSSGTNTITSSATTNNFTSIATTGATNTITLSASGATNIVSENITNSSGSNTITLDGTNTINGDITGNAGANTITTGSGTLGLTKDGASISVVGGATATNTITASTLNITNASLSANGNGNGNNDNYITASTTGNIVFSTISVNGGNDKNSNVVNLANGTLKVLGDITATRGKNILNNTAGTLTLGDASTSTAISISAGNAQNFISLGSGGANTLTLSSISVNNANGRNYLAKNIVTGSTAADSVLVSNYENSWANTSYQAAGTLTTSSDVTATNGKNYINIASVTIGGNLSVSGGSASNNIATASLTTKAISSASGGVNNLISSGTSSVGGDISVVGNGKNYLISSDVATLGNGEAIAISADAGENILSIDATGANTLTLSSVSSSNGGKNYIAKGIIEGGVATSTLSLKSNLTTNSYLNDAQAFGGSLLVVKGVSGENAVSFVATSAQTNSAISNIVRSEDGNSLALGNAISGANTIYLNVAASSIGSGVKAIQGYFAALSGSGGTLQDAQKTLLDSSVIAGNIVNSGTTNIKIKGTQNTLASSAPTVAQAEDKAQIGILGNISNNSGALNIVLEDTFFAPSELIVSSASGTLPSQPITYANTPLGDKNAGNISTASGATTNIITRFTNPVANSTGISMYNIDANEGSTTNVVIQGNVDLGTHIDYAKGSAVNLIFANANDGASDNFEGEHTDLAGKESQVLGVTYQDGVKLAIADKTVMIGDNPSASFLETYSSYYTDGSKPLATVWANRTSTKDTVGIEGLVVGDIYSLTSSTGGSQTKKIYDVTLESGSAFAGKIKLDPSSTSAINIVMKENSKLILSDTNDISATDTFVISSLEIQSGVVDQYQLQMETLKQTNNVINLASGGASANNVAERENFRLLVVGNATDVNTPAVTGGLSGDGKAVFMTYVNTNADQNKATLGKVASSGKTPTYRAGGATGDGQYGNIYSDRIIIANIGDNQTAKSGDYYMQFAVDAKSKLGSVTYNASNDVAGNNNGGVKTAGNIAVLTVANVSDGNGGKVAGINLKTQDVLQGFDRIGGDLIGVQTDINGVYDSNGAYTTYFVNNLITRGATEATQEVTASAFATNYDLYLANFNSLNKRMGELRDNANSQGVWARVFSGAQSNDFSKSKSTYTTIQGGYDYALGFEGANNYIGLAVSYSMSSSKSDLNAIDINGSTKGIEDIKSSAVEVAVYNSYVQDEGWYNDTIAKFSYIMSDFTMIGQTSNYSTNNMAFTLSDEFGYRFKLGEAREWYIDPQLEIGFGYFNQSDFVQTLGLSSLEGVAESIYTTRARLGSSFGYDFKKFTENKPIKASVYVGAFYEYDYVVGGDVTLTTNLGGETVSSGAISSDGRVVVNVGTNMTIKDNTRIYFDFETSFAGKIRTDYQANVGVRYSFGENLDYLPINENTRVSAPLKVSDENTEESEELESVENTQESTQTTTSEQTSEASKESANSKDNKTEESAEVKSEEKAQ